MNEEVIVRVEAARIQAMHKHGKLTTNYVRAVLILTEEVGEVAKAALEMTRRDHGDEWWHREQVMDELAQVAQTAMAMMVNILEEIEK